MVYTLSTPLSTWAKVSQTFHTIKKQRHLRSLLGSRASGASVASSLSSRCSSELILYVLRKMNSSQRFRIHYLVLCGLNSGYGCESKSCPKGYQKHSTTSYFQTVELSQTVPASRIFVSRCPQMPIRQNPAPRLGVVGLLWTHTRWCLRGFSILGLGAWGWDLAAEANFLGGNRESRNHLKVRKRSWRSGSSSFRIPKGSSGSFMNRLSSKGCKMQAVFQWCNGQRTSQEAAKFLSNDLQLNPNWAFPRPRAHPPSSSAQSRSQSYNSQTPGADHPMRPGWISGISVYI